MKFRNFLLSTKVLKYILNDPKCTVPQIRDAFGVKHSNPPLQEEKNLYKAISYLNNSELIRKIDFDSILPGGAHFHLMITLKGKKVIRFFEKTFNVIERNYFHSDPVNTNIREKVNKEDLAIEFSQLSHKVLEEFRYSLINELPQDERRILGSQKPKLKIIQDKLHKKLQEKVSNIIDSLF